MIPKFGHARPQATSSAPPLTKPACHGVDSPTGMGRDDYSPVPGQALPSGERLPLPGHPLASRGSAGPNLLSNLRTGYAALEAWCEGINKTLIAGVGVVRDAFSP